MSHFPAFRDLANNYVEGLVNGSLLIRERDQNSNAGSYHYVLYSLLGFPDNKELLLVSSTPLRCAISQRQEVLFSAEGGVHSQKLTVSLAGNTEQLLIGPGDVLLLSIVPPKFTILRSGGWKGIILFDSGGKMISISMDSLGITLTEFAPQGYQLMERERRKIQPPNIDPEREWFKRDFLRKYVIYKIEVFSSYLEMYIWDLSSNEYAIYRYGFQAPNVNPAQKIVAGAWGIVGRIRNSHTYLYADLASGKIKMKNVP
jgi:hypothetical protein